MVTTELISAAKNGDLVAFNQIVIAVQNKIYSLAYWLCPDEVPVEAVTQTVIQCLFHNLEDCSNGKFYLWTIRNLVQVCRPLMNGSRSISSNGSVLRRGLDCLPPDSRLALVLVDIEGLDYAQAVDVLKLPNWLLRRRLASARRQMMEFYQQNGYDLFSL